MVVSALLLNLRTWSSSFHLSLPADSRRNYKLSHLLLFVDRKKSSTGRHRSTYLVIFLERFAVDRRMTQKETQKNTERHNDKHFGAFVQF